MDGNGAGWYVYCIGDPINGNDPMGLGWLDLVLGYLDDAGDWAKSIPDQVIAGVPGGTLPHEVKELYDVATGKQSVGDLVTKEWKKMPVVGSINKYNEVMNLPGSRPIVSIIDTLAAFGGGAFGTWWQSLVALKWP